MEQSHGSIGHGQVDNANGLVATIPTKDRAHPVTVKLGVNCIVYSVYSLRKLFIQKSDLNNRNKK